MTAETTERGGDAKGERTRRRLTSSARLRLVASVVGLVAFSTLLSNVLARQILLARVSERVEESLVQEVEELERLVADGRDPRTGEPFGSDVGAIFSVFLSRNVPSEREDFHAFVDRRLVQTTARVATEGELVRRVLPLGAARTVQRGELETAREGDVRFLGVPVVIGGRPRGVFAVTVGLEGEQEEVGEVVRVVGGASLLVLLIAGALAFGAAGRILAPLRELTDTARSISESDLTRRIAVRGDDELAQLGLTFNAMLDRLEAAFSTQQTFVSDAGHELRTPITIIRGHLELLGDDPQERRETIELVTDELDRMARFVDDLLTLAKAERPDFLRLADVDLDALTEELAAKGRALADRRWTVDAVGTGRLTADRQRLTQAVMSLAQNAVQHTRQGDEIALGTALTDGSVRLWVRDTGPGVPEEDRERIFERFARGEGHRPSGGAGLGLAIVRAIAQAHGGRIELESRTGRPSRSGSTFTVVVPAEPEEAPA